MNNIPPMAPLPRDQRNVDEDHLNLLSIFYFVTAGMALLTILFFIGDYEFINHMFANPDLWKGQKGGPPPAEFFAMFKWMVVVFGIICLVGGIMNLMTGVFLRRRKHRTFSLVIAAINCLQVPIGTALGAFTIVVLIRPSVAKMYEN